jgi:hypothetical protein
MAFKILPEKDTTAIVVVGPFTPKMFHPLWFEARGLMGRQEASEAEISLVHDDLTQFRTTRMLVDVQAGRFMVTTDISPDDVRDLVLQIFTLFLAGVPVTAVGINRGVHFDVGPPNIQHKIGLELAPPAPWGAWGQKMATLGADGSRSGMLSLRMQQFRPEGQPAGYVQVRVEASELLKKTGKTGIFMDINNHYDIRHNPPEGGDASGAMVTLSEQWSQANACAEEIINQIMDLAKLATVL